MLGERLSHLDNHIDWEHPEESYLFDPMEHLAGVGVVAAQRYLASICNWFSVDRTIALRLGPKKKGVPVASVVHAAAIIGSTLKTARDQYILGRVKCLNRLASHLIRRTAYPAHCMSAVINSSPDSWRTSLVGAMQFQSMHTRRPNKVMQRTPKA